MSESDQHPDRRIHLFCKKQKEGYTVMVGAGWMHPRLRPLFDENFESAPALLDFEHLSHMLGRENGTCDVRESNYGSKQVSANGRSATIVAKWLSGAMASGIVKR